MLQEKNLILNVRVNFKVKLVLNYPFLIDIQPIFTRSGLLLAKCYPFQFWNKSPKFSLSGTERWDHLCIPGCRERWGHLAESPWSWWGWWRRRWGRWRGPQWRRHEHGRPAARLRRRNAYVISIDRKWLIKGMMSPVWRPTKSNPYFLYMRKWFLNF